MKTKKNLSGHSLIMNLRKQFALFSDERSNSIISMADAATSAFAIFKFKFPSLLEFDRQRKDCYRAQNLKSIFGLKAIPSDTQIRTILDKVPYQEFFSVYKNIFSLLQREKVISSFKYNIPGAGDFLIDAVDGTGYFSSTAIKCDCCLVKEVKSKKDNIPDDEIQLVYHHQMLGSGIVHPDKKLVIPFAPEPILQQDGASKNDSELSAMKRYLFRLKDEHPRTPFLICTDALHSKSTIISLIKSFEWSFVMMVKRASHKTLYEQMDEEKGEEKTVIIEDEIGVDVIKKRTRVYKIYNNLNLIKNGIEVSVLDFREIITWKNKKGEQKKEVHFTWSTDIFLNEENIYEVMRAGRSRWKDENEIFNVLKNHGYQLEHNYGHGKENLSANFAMFATLAFLVDQIEEISCSLYQTARDVMSVKYVLWERIKTMIEIIKFESWTDLLEAIAFKKKYETSNSS